jgi:hypothetical protein
MRMVALILLAKLFFKELLISLAILTKLTITSTNNFFFFFRSAENFGNSLFDYESQDTCLGEF